MAKPNADERSRLLRFLDTVERLGNRLPDPAVLFVFGLFATWGASKALAGVEFSEIDPRSIKPDNPAGSPIRVNDLLTGPAFAVFLAGLVKTYTDFHPLGVVLVALLGVGVADHAGLIGAGLPYSVVFLIAWTAYLLVYRALGIPLGPDAAYEYVRAL
jgi:aminobenzoyl-glutamate transport protein